MKKLRGVIIIVVCACLCVGYYFYLSQRDTAGNRAPTEFEQLTGKDLNKSYPNTPREVIRFYNRILKYLYSQEPTEDEVKVLGQQARILFDEELLEQNPENVYLAGLGNELAQYAKEKKDNQHDSFYQPGSGI